MSTLRSLAFAALLLAGAAHAGDPAPGQGFIDVGPGPVWYSVSGTGDGVPLLVLHGGPGGTSCGYTRFDVLGPERPVVRYDQLGTGRSGRPDDLSLWTAERYVEELHRVRNALGLERLHLLGHSWGGALAAAYVIEKGTDGIVSLTLSSPLLSTRDWVADANLLRKQLPEEVQQVLAEHEAAGTIDSPEYQAASAEFYRRFVWAGDRPEGSAACEGAPWSELIYNYMWGPTEFRATGNLLDFDVTPRLGEIEVPVLLVAGEFDEARPATLARYQQKIPGARLAVINGVAHASYSKAPEAYMAVLREFLARAESN